MNVESLEIFVLAEEHASGLFWAQHGISFLLSIEVDGSRHELLFDTGNSWEPIKHNLKLLGRSVKEIKALILSHRHYDHTGGLRGLLSEIERPIPIIAHPDVLKPNFVLPFRDIGLPISAEEIRSLGGKLLLTRDPIEILPGVITTGEVPRITELEKEMTIETYTIDEEGRLVRDPIMDDLSLVVRMDGGSIVITGCSHAGIVNIVKRARQLAGPVRAVIGGFHLIKAPESRIEGTAEALKDLGVQKVITGHCTGLAGECILRKEFGEDFEQLATGSILRFK